jgi:hypothetical protein
MHPKKYALVGGIVMLALGVLALVPSLYENYAANADLPPLALNTSYGLFLGIFPMNILNKLALIVFGIGGIFAASAPTTNLPKSILWSRLVFFVMGVAAILGAIPQTNTLNGYWPLFNAEVWAHGIFAVLGAYFGFVLSSAAKTKLDQKISTKNAPLGI